MRYIVAYDIANDKRRKKLSDLLEGYGIRVNYSVFEIELNQTKKERLLFEIERQKLIHPKHDSLRFYHLCQNCVAKSFELADKPEPFESEEMFI
ncbi:CRISPR-associated protein Cas2 [hydrothermal vent metagenome]|uniref:CRISPR-associated protein Cas2 n=1 Tax=hydrothermal vent metagenome TaxID=652676 RepID=A0A1W1BEL8_9ZZZZ